MTVEELRKIGFKPNQWLDSNDPDEQMEIHKLLENLKVTLYLNTEHRINANHFKDSVRYIFYEKFKDNVLFLKVDEHYAILKPEYALTIEEFKSIIKNTKKFIDNSNSNNNTILNEQLKTI